MAKKSTPATAQAAEEVTEEIKEQPVEAETGPTEETPATAQAAEDGGENEPEPEAAKETTAPGTPVDLGIFITNTRFGVKMLKVPSGVLALYPGVVTRVAKQDEEAVRKLFKSKTFKNMVDSGAFRFTDYETAEGLLGQETPKPPENLTKPEPIESLGSEAKVVQDLKVVGFHDATPTE